MNETIPGTDFQVQSTYQEAYGQTREMFTTVAGHVAYAGTYKCLDTKEFAPRGMVLPAGLVSFLFDVTEMRGIKCSI